MKTFQQFVTEMPQINSYVSKARVGRMAEYTKKDIKNSSSKETNHGSFYHKIIDGENGDTDAYYKKDSEGQPTSFSLVHDHVHVLTHKGSGSAKDIHQYMLHHAKQHGSLSSDKSNTEGSKNLWKTLVKSNPKDYRFHYNDSSGNKVNVHKDNIDDHSDKIWGTSLDHSKVKLVMTHDK